METKFAQTREELLQSLIDRKQPRALDIQKGACVYDHNINGGCAIGCQIEKALAKELGSKNILKAFKLLPKRLTGMGGTFLRRVQSTHDSKDSWINAKTAETKDGLVWSTRGIVRINGIIKDFDLSIEPLKV